MDLQKYELCHCRLQNVSEDVWMMQKDQGVSFLILAGAKVLGYVSDYGNVHLYVQLEGRENDRHYNEGNWPVG